ncbi:peptidase [Bacillus mycoides]|nr:peptidase [Bacillus mycoides]
MELLDIQQKYDAIFSLGNTCFVAGKLQNYNLRSCAGVIDWMLSFSLTDVIRLLQNKFEGFMEKETMEFDAYHACGTKLLLTDIRYNIKSAHDFPAEKNTPENWTSYPEFKIKINRRIERFLNKLKTSNLILFVRIGGTYEEVELLEKVLSNLIPGEFRILLLNEISEYKIIEYNWNLKYTCSVGIPMDGNQNYEIWNQLLKGITRKESI